MESEMNQFPRMPLASVTLDDVVSTSFQKTRVETTKSTTVTLWVGIGVEIAEGNGRTRVVPLTKVKTFEFPR